MCSIFAILNIEGDSQALRELALRQSRLMRHRGPDWSGSHTCEGAVLAHERLAIVDINTGAQPLLSPDGKQSLAVNGEIYNHRSLRKSLANHTRLRPNRIARSCCRCTWKKATDF